MLAFHGKIEIKEEYRARLRAHHAADELIRGEYWDGHRGCAVGCTVKEKLGGNWHEAYQNELGIPMSLAYLEDRIFENLPEADAPGFAVDFLEAVSVGADLSLVTHAFLVWLLADPVDGVIRFAFEDGKLAIQAVASLHGRALSGDPPTLEEWSAARSAARSAAESAGSAARSAAESSAAAAWSAARSAAARSAARSAAESAGSAEWSAEWSAARSAAAAAAATSAEWSAAYTKMAEKLLDLLRSAPVAA